MQEAQFSCNFRMFNRDGELEQFTVRGETAQEFADNRAALEQLLSAGYAWKLSGESETGSAVKMEDIEGYVVGETKNNDICVFVYTAWSNQFGAAYTLYPEDKHLFPAAWPTKCEWDGSSPSKDVAKSKGRWHDLQFKLPLIPVLDAEKNVVKNEKGYIKYRPHRYYQAGNSTPSAPSGTAANQPARPQPSVGTIQYTHKRKLPNVGKYDTSQIGSESADEPVHNDWWCALNAAEQDTLMYGRTFVASYKKAPASEHAQRVWGAVTKQLADLSKLDERIVKVYAHYALTDHAHDPEEPPLTGIVQWLAECAMPTKGDGSANPNHDPEWMGAFANLLIKVYAADSAGGDDDEPPFDFADGDSELSFTV